MPWAWGSTRDAELEPGLLLEAATVALTHEPLPRAQVVAGSPTTATLVLDERDGREIGVWEMTPGTAIGHRGGRGLRRAGRAARTVEFTAVAEGAVPRPSSIGPGRSCGSSTGMQTTWTVHETLRKVYLA